MQDFKEHVKSRKHDTIQVHNNVPLIDLKDMEIYDSLAKEFEIACLESSVSYMKTQKDKSIKPGNQYTNKVRSSTK